MSRFLYVLLAASLFFSSCGSKDKYIVFNGYAQGGTYSVKINIKDVRVKQAGIKAAVDSILFDIDTTLSGYNKSSMLSRFNAGEKIVPNAIFIDIYNRSSALFELSEGAFDVASGPLFDMWGFGFKNDSLPSVQSVVDALSRCGFKLLKRDMADAVADDGTLSSVNLLVDGGGQGPVLNYNAIAQGYSADLVASYLNSIGVTDMLVDIGEIYCRGRNPQGKPWSIGVDRPVDGNNTLGADLKAVHKCSAYPQGIVTSGNYRKFYIRDGKKYAHTIDPRSGYPVSHNLLSATIIAEDSATADAVATWCMVIGLEEARAVVSKYGYEAYLIYDEGGEMKTWHTEGFNLDEY